MRDLSGHTCVSTIDSKISPTGYPTWPGTTIIDGDSGYTTYYKGDGPIIFVVNHGGYDSPDIDDVEEREDGCYNSQVVPKCDWLKEEDPDCALDPAGKECVALKTQDEFTREIGQCLQSRTTFTVPASCCQILYPHLIINELHRKYLDSNRQLEEAAQGKNGANVEQAFNEMHSDEAGSFVLEAKEQAIDRCGFGLLLDIHGHDKNDFIQFGYRMSRQDVDKSDEVINLEGSDNRERSSVAGLAEVDNEEQPTVNNMADIIRGPNSLGTILSSKDEEYLTIPSSDHPRIDETEEDLGLDEGKFYYFTGDFTVKRHGSSLSDTVKQTDDGDGASYKTFCICLDKF